MIMIMIITIMIIIPAGRRALRCSRGPRWPLRARFRAARLQAGRRTAKRRLYWTIVYCVKSD